MSLVVRVGRKYAVYLPREVVERLGLREGDKLLLRVKKDEIVIKPLPRLLTEREAWTETSLEEHEAEAEAQTRLAEEETR